MKNEHRHPPDLLPYLEGETSDKNYGAIKLHLESCRECQDEVLALRSLDDFFRSPDLEIEVPAFQWQRIQARLTERSVEPSWRGWLVSMLKPGRLAFSISMSIVLIFGAAFFGWEYRRQLTRDQILAITAYSETERLRIDRAENPFSAYAVSPSDENPFTRFQNTDAGNPFTVR